MYFLVDFENVHSEGLRGVEFLKRSDSLTLFFSNAAHVCESRYLKAIVNSGCSFDTCKLARNGKNGRQTSDLSRFPASLRKTKWINDI